jgi:hypothetical protein
MSNWKTTACGALSAGASFILFAQTAHYINFPPWLMAIAMFAQVGGLTVFGIVAKDYNTK